MQVEVLDGVIAARLAEALPDVPLPDFLHQLRCAPPQGSVAQGSPT